MANKYPKYSPVGDYWPANLTAVQASVAPIGQNVNTTANAITAGVNVTVTPASIVNILPDMRLNLVDGANSEWILVKSVNITAGTFVADFANSHTTGKALISQRSTWLGPVTINNPGSGTVTLTLYNGNPNLLPNIVTPGYGKIATLNITSTTPDKLYAIFAQFGLWYTLAASVAAPDLTLHYLDDAAL